MILLQHPPDYLPTPADRWQIEAGYRWLHTKIVYGRGMEVAERLKRTYLTDSDWGTPREGRAAYRAIVDNDRAHPVFDILGWGGGSMWSTDPNIPWLKVDVLYASPKTGARVRFSDWWRRIDGRWDYQIRQDALLSFKDADVREVFRAFGATNVEASPNLRKLTLDTSGKDFDEVLSQALVRLDATCRVENGVYRVEPRPYDEAMGTVVPTLRFDGEEIRPVLRWLFQKAGARYRVSPKVKGRVVVDLRNFDFETALQIVLRQIGATYRIEEGVYKILPQPIPPSKVPLGSPIQAILRR